MGFKISLIIVLAALNAASGTWDKVLTRTEPQKQKDEVDQLLQRVVPDHGHLFEVEIRPELSGLLDKERLFNFFGADTYLPDKRSE